MKHAVFAFLVLVISSSLAHAQVNVDQGIELAAGYIIANTNDAGRLAYERHINPAVLPNVKRYNILRHAGTIYSTHLYEEVNPNNPEMHATRLRLTDYLLKNYCIEIQDGMYTIVSTPEEEKVPEPQAKVGAVGLALIGITDLVAEGKVPLKTVQGMGDFILYMQKEDGSFWSKYVYSTKSRDGGFISMYYPGEAALGLLYLYDVDPQEKWLDGCKKALFFLADSRKDLKVVPEFDHWAMLATRKLLENPKNGLSADEKKRLLFHARQMAEMVLPTQIFKQEDLIGYGSMGGNISPCSNGTKAEGLIAIYAVMKDDPELQKRILTALDRLCGFLLRAQIKGDYLRGGFPSSAAWRMKGGPKKAYTVRIDNVQHIMSAWINYRKIERK